MAISEYTKEGKTFYKVYVQVRGKEIKRLRLQKVLTGIETLNTARREEKKLLLELAEKLAKLEGKGLLWSEVIERWQAAGNAGQLHSKLNSFTINDHVNRLNRYTTPWFNILASELTRADGRRVLDWAKSQNASATLLSKIKTSINLVFNWGTEEGLIKGSTLGDHGPVHGLGIDLKDEKIKPILTLDEVRKFLFEAKIRNHPWYPIWAFAILTGMRSGELMALEWGDIDERAGIIRVTKSFNKRLKLVKCPKNGTWRNVDINFQLAGLLKSIKQECRNEDKVLPVFPEWRNGQAGVVLRKFLERIGISKPVVFHTLRACFATHLLATGVEPLKVMRMGGWADLKTFQIYLRLSGVDVRGVAAQLEVLPVNLECEKLLLFPG